MRRRWIIGGLLLVIVAWAGLGLTDVASARRHATAALNAADRAVDQVRDGDLTGATETIEEALADLDTAARRLERLTVWPARLVPFAGTELRAAHAGVNAARSTSLATLDVLYFLGGRRPPLLEETTINPAVFDLLRDSLDSALRHAQDAQRLLEEAPRPRITSTARRLDRVSDVSDGLQVALTATTRVTDRVGDAVGGGDPFRVLVLFENGAELRATGGLMGFVALVTVDDGEILLEQAQDVHALAEKDADGEHLVVDAPQDYVDRYGEFLANTTLWLNVNLSPHFPSVAEVASRLYERVTDIRPDAVVRMDLVAVGYLLDSFAGLTVEGQPFDASELATGFLLDSYRRFPSNEEHSPYLAEVFDDLFEQLIGGVDGDAGSLVRAIQRALDENRFAAYTGDPTIDDALTAAGADGALDPGDAGELEVSVQNFGANKVDLFTTTAIEVTTQADGCTMRGRSSVSLGNRLPEGVDYLPDGTGEGTGVWWVSFFLPRDATVLAIEVDGEDALGGLDTEQRRPAASMLVETPPGGTVTAAVEWSEPLTSAGYELEIRPQPHLIPATLAVNGEGLGELIERLSYPVATDCSR